MAEATGNKVRFGLDKVAIAPIGDDGKWETPIMIPGAVSLTTNPQGETSNFYADNIPYFTVVTNSGYEGDLEMALIPDDVMIKLGLLVKDENGAVYEDADLNPVPFAMLFRVMGDKRNRLNVMYNCTAQRPTAEQKTKEDNTTVTTEKLSFSAIPKEIEGHKVTKLSIEPTDANKEVYDSFYEDVLVPKHPVEGEQVLQSIEIPESVNEASTKAQLEAYAAAHDIDISDCTTNAQKLAKIRASEDEGE